MGSSVGGRNVRIPRFSTAVHKAHPLKREFIVMNRGNVYWPGLGGGPLVYYYGDHPDLLDQLDQLQGEHLITEITYNNTKRYRISERLAEYLGAP